MTFWWGSTNGSCLYTQNPNLKFSTSIVGLGCGKVGKTTKLNSVPVKFPDTVTTIISELSVKVI